MFGGKFYFSWAQNQANWGWRDGSWLRAFVLAKDLSSISSMHMEAHTVQNSSSRRSDTQLSDVHDHQKCTWHIDTHSSKTLMHIKYTSKELKKKEQDN